MARSSAAVGDGNAVDKEICAWRGAHVVPDMMDAAASQGAARGEKALAAFAMDSAMPGRIGLCGAGVGAGPGDTAGQRWAGLAD